ncbi:efflux RND transporter periplasmic adaptor subunit [Marinomonas sp.]
MKRLPQWIALVLALAVLAGVYVYISAAIAEKNSQVRKPRPEAPEEAIQISVIEATTGTYSAKINASGLVEPRYELTLTNQVSGEVSQLSNQFESGQIVKKGHLLASLNNSELSSNVASAKNTLASAVLALKEEIRQGEQAKAEWQAAGFNTAPDSDLVLREPQLAAAQAEVDAAKEALKDAQADLAHTKIKAPFDALITARSISPGRYLSSDSEVGTLYSIDRAEIQIDLSNSDWLKLPDTSTLLEKKWPVTIHSIDDDSQWQGKILSVGLHIDETTRMRSLVIGLDNPLTQSTPLLLGSFVTISLEGKALDNLWRLPNTALSQKSEIWYLDEDSRLAAFETTPKFVDTQYVYIDVPVGMRDKSYQVLIKPYNSYIKGALVAPIENINASQKGNQP